MAAVVVAAGAVDAGAPVFPVGVKVGGATWSSGVEVCEDFCPVAVR